MSLAKLFRNALRVAAAGALTALGAIALTGAPAATALPGAFAPAPVLDPANFDTTCDACDDFWRYATGGWRSRTKIPPGHPAWSTFDEIQERNEDLLGAILTEAAADAATTTDPDRARVGTFYAACRDVAAIEAGGLQALQPDLDRINAISSPAGVVAAIAYFDRLGVDNGLGFASEPDERDSSKTIAGIGFGGLGLPDRDDYFLARDASIRAAYVHYVSVQLTNIGDDPAAAVKHAHAVVALETILAGATPTDADLRDPLAAYHPMPVARLHTIAPNIPWPAFLGAFGQARLRAVDLGLPKYTAVFDRQLVATPLDTWKALLRAHLVSAFASALPHRFDAAHFDFYGRVLQGTHQPLPRAKRCAIATDRALGDPLGKLYVARTFSPAAKTRARRLVNALQAELHGDLTTLAWMSPTTRREAIVKLDAYTKKIGYPDRWIDYSPVTLRATDPYLFDLAKTLRFTQARDLARIGKPTDRGLWGLTPSTVNAYYNPSNNEIVFPAGILQPPFFDPRADDAVVYGAIGAIIGHEMTHGFDDVGRQFDAQGNLRDWWTPGDAARFKARARCIIRQFDGYRLEPGLRENGRLVTGEAIADLGGATIAYRAFARSAQYRAHRKIDGYTPEQRFFLSFAQNWRQLSTPQYERELAVSDPHPATRFRLIGTLGNMPEFARAFACAQDAPMVRRDRCAVW